MYENLSKEIKEFFQWIATSVYNMGQAVQLTEVWLHCQISDKSGICYSVKLLGLEMVVILVLDLELWPQPQAVKKIL